MTSRREVEIRTTTADVRQWLRGQYPQPIHLATAATLIEWQVVWIAGDEAGSMALQGIVSGSKITKDGSVIRTSPVILLDRNLEWCRTANSVYRLERQAGIDVPIEGVWT